MVNEGNFWETRSLDRFTKEIGEQSIMLASFLGDVRGTRRRSLSGATLAGAV